MPSSAISFREARAIVVQELSLQRQKPASEHVDLAEANGRVLAENVYADRDYPALDRTARDGFAVRAADMPGRVRVIGEVRAGAVFSGHVGSGEAVEIMTGAPIPEGADTIVMVEHVQRDGDFVSYDGETPAGQFINQRGSESPFGSLLLPTGTRLGFAAIGLLASVGCALPAVFVKPRVAIIATGDELVSPGERPEAYQIRNSNASSLAAQVQRAGGIPEMLEVARDDEAQTRRLIEDGLGMDMLLLSGGVSAGKYDVVELAFQALEARFYFDRVAIQPGQPLVFGRARERFFFGLPGNPASTMVTFELFGRTALEMLAGQPAREPVFLEAALTQDYRHRPGLTRFLPAWVSSDGNLTPVAWTGSSDIAALARSNCWMRVDPDRAAWKAGDGMPILLT